MNATPTAVVLIDLQEGFFEFPDLADHRELMIREANWLAGVARAGGHPVLVVNTMHQRDRSTWTLKMLEDGQGFNFEGSSQAAPLTGLDLRPTAVLTKTRDSAFFGTGLADRLRAHGLRRLILAGVTAESCVSATGRDAFAHDFEVVYARLAIASSDADRGWRDLENLGADFRQPILNRPDLERLLAGK
ncbi:cysteine hydrolase family protein [Microbacterium sp. A93]|uniref:cysteine hydrolase family protein n=1 Tax=Microbacterium sp. A93 TaxID=3450716 RepID=UPI003F421D91